MCWLSINDHRYMALWATHTPAIRVGVGHFNKHAATKPCKHLGAGTGRVELCVLCGDKNMRELQACAVHGECVQEKQLAYRKDGQTVSVPWCVTCKDYEPN